MVHCLDARRANPHGAQKNGRAHTSGARAPHQSAQAQTGGSEGHTETDPHRLVPCIVSCGAIQGPISMLSMDFFSWNGANNLVEIDRQSHERVATSGTLQFLDIYVPLIEYNNKSR